MRGEGPCGHWRERGAVTAEFVIAMPALLLVLALSIGSIALATQRLTLTAAAGEVARLEARGDQPAARARVAAAGPAVSVSRSRDGPLLCVTLRGRPGPGLLSAIQLAATGCAAIVVDATEPTAAAQGVAWTAR